MMLNKEINKYRKLNNIAESNGTVFIGNGEDVLFPIAELADSFGIDCKFYNRSSFNLSITEAINYYDNAVESLNPNRVILHVGANDIDLFNENSSLFDNNYCKLIDHIREDNRECNIGIISLENPQSDDVIKNINLHLQMIANSQHCEYEDIGTPRLWNPVETKNAITFASTMGLSNKIFNSISIYDFASIFFGFNSGCIN